MDSARPLTTADLEALERSTAQAFAIVCGLLAEAVGSHQLAYHFGAALSANAKTLPNPQRERLLEEAFHLVLMKALHHAPDDAILQTLAAKLRAGRQSH